MQTQMAPSMRMAVPFLMSCELIIKICYINNVIISFQGVKAAIKREQKSLLILPSVSSFAPFQGAKVQKKVKSEK
jgi:hypothetical protein